MTPKQEESTEVNAKHQSAKIKITEAPKLAYTPPRLDYPASAIKNNEEGKVKVKAVIDAKGQIRQVFVVQSSGFGDLDQAAVTWFKKLKFTPAKSDDKTVAATVEQTISFNFQEQKYA